MELFVAVFVHLDFLAMVVRIRTELELEFAKLRIESKFSKIMNRTRTGVGRELAKNLGISTGQLKHT